MTRLQPNTVSSKKEKKVDENAAQVSKDSPESFELIKLSLVASHHGQVEREENRINKINEATFFFFSSSPFFRCVESQ